jgi:hypothetical protein
VDEQIAKEAKKAFDKQGLKIELGVKVGEIKSGDKGVSIAWTNAKGEAQTLDVDKLIVSIGRVPNTIGLNAEGRRPEAGRARLDRGRRRVQDQPAGHLGHRRRGARPMLAHKAEEEGVAVAERHRRPALARQLQHHPLGDLHQPRDRLGRPDRAAAQGGRRASTRPAPSRSWRTAARARWATHRHGEVPGRRRHRRDPRACHIVGPMASELISERWWRWSSAPPARTSPASATAHPSLSEATKEAGPGRRQAHAELLNRRREVTSVLAQYRAELKRAGFRSDPAQLRAVEALEPLRPRVGRVQGASAPTLQEADQPARTSARRLHVRRRGARQELPDGLLLHGVPLVRKTRLHFHEFMREVHRELAEPAGHGQNPLDELGERIGQSATA